MSTETKSEGKSTGEMLPVRNLGSQGLKVPCLGLGCMGMTAFYSSSQGEEKDEEKEEQSLACLDRALELGCNFLDTARVYTNNEALLSKTIKKHGRDKFIIATKWYGGGDKATILKQLGESLAALETDYVDLFYMHRMDRNTPIEDTMGVLKELIAEGKIKYIGLSECSASELERAHKVVPISAIQMEWSLQSRSLEKEVVPMARKLGVGIVAYSPLARGMLSSKFKTFEDIPEDDWRRSQPRFTKENFEANKAKIVAFEAMAKDKSCTPAQLALAWVIAQGDDVVPIPGTKNVKRLEQNCGSAFVKLSKEDLAFLDGLSLEGEGSRYSAGMMEGCHEAGK